MNWETNLKYWKDNAPKNVLEAIDKFTQEELEWYFEKDLQFGTAGIRGVIGYAPGLMNEFIIAKYSLAFGKQLLSKYGEAAKEWGIVIAHDNRRNNILYSETAAKVISALGIPVSLFEDNELQPTPLLSYTIAQNNYVGGINITASHNPPEYQGYKVYDDTGTQILPDIVESIVKNSEEDINIFNIEQNNKNIKYISRDIEETYIKHIIDDIPFNGDEDRTNIKVVFTPQHGTAHRIGEKIMKKMNVSYVMVKEQSTPDPEFTNTKSPNPQNPDAFILAREYGDKNEADVIFATDPDADRFGVEVKHNNEWIHISGNHLPLIQINYKLMKLKEMGYISKGDFIIRSVVTSNQADRIAEKYGVDVYKSLTGFKWLINEAFKHELMGNEALFVWEESYGSTIRTFTRDKDSFQALAQVIEIVKYYKDKEMTLVDALNEIQEEIGFYQSPQETIKIEGKDGMKIMLEIIEKFKSIKVGDQFDNLEVTKCADFSKGYKEYPKDNILMIRFNNEHSISIRPSGTEPLLRIYYNSVGTTRKESKTYLEKLQNIVKEVSGE